MKSERMLVSYYKLSEYKNDLVQQLLKLCIAVLHLEVITGVIQFEIVGGLTTTHSEVGNVLSQQQESSGRYTRMWTCTILVHMVITYFVIGRSSIFQVHRTLFRSCQQPGPIRRRRQSYHSTPYYQQTWSHKFYCLSNKMTTNVPSSKQQREALVACGLGENTITIAMHSSADELHQMILSTFPKLSSCGGYELIRCIGNSKTLNIIEPPYTAVNLCSTVGQSRIYVRPLQSNKDFIFSRSGIIV